MSKYLKEIEFQKYKSFDSSNIVKLSDGLNAISGDNGTGKSTLLHIISNSYQRCVKTLFNNPKALRIIRNNIQVENPKIENLNKGDKIYNDPAPGVGTYFLCKFSDGQSSSFRRHTSKKQSGNQRFRVIPKYKKGVYEKLDYAFVAYLGISRLVPYGELSDNVKKKNFETGFPKELEFELMELYRDFTTYQITNIKTENIEQIKKRVDFTTTKEGIDSNTISSGEDNLFILLNTLVALKYLRLSLKDEYKTIPAILLIDEIDATLHADYQIKLIDKLQDYSEIGSVNKSV